MGSQSGPLWAITAYFNPARYRQRRHNYREFRRRLSAPLLTVELGYDGRFELGNRDADVLIRVEGWDVMWQKERLLNIGLRALPSECRYVAWLDCDVVFERSDWTEATCRTQDDCPVVHLFGEVYELGRTELAEAPLGSGTKGMSILAVTGVEEDAGELLRGNMRGNHSVHSGLAWVARSSAGSRTPSITSTWDRDGKPTICRGPSDSTSATKAWSERSKAASFTNGTDVWTTAGMRSATPPSPVAANRERTGAVKAEPSLVSVVIDRRGGTDAEEPVQSGAAGEEICVNEES